MQLPKLGINRFNKVEERISELENKAEESIHPTFIQG